METRILLTIIGLTVVSVVTRSFFLLLNSPQPLSPSVQRSLRYAPVGALIGIVAPEIFIVQGANGESLFQLSNPQLWGGLAATVAMLASRSMLFTLLVGMSVFSLFRVWPGW